MKTYGKHLFPGRLFIVEGIDGLVKRVAHTAGFNYWESGMDLHLGEDMYDSFIEYQSRLLAVFDHMADEYGFHVVETSANIEDVFGQIKHKLEPLLIPAV